MRTFSESLKKDAARVGAEMLADGDSIREIPFGQTKDCLFVSNDPNSLRWMETLVVSSTTLYIGTKAPRYAHP